MTASSPSKLSRFQVAVIALLAALVVAAVVIAILVAAASRAAEIADKKAACDVHPVGSVERLLCLELADD